MPRATLFKPPKKVDLEKNPLWCEVFMHESSEDSGGSDSEADEKEIMQMYKEAMMAKGIKYHNQPDRIGTAQDLIKKNNDLVLPPIKKQSTGTK